MAGLAMLAFRINLLALQFAIRLCQWAFRAVSRWRRR